MNAIKTYIADIRLHHNIRRNGPMDEFKRILYEYPSLMKIGLLMTASSYDNVHVVRYLIKNNYYKVNDNDSISTPLLYAVSNNSHRVVRYLIRQNVNVNSTHPTYDIDETPLSLAVSNKNIKIIKMLIGANAIVTEETCQTGNTSIMSILKLLCK